MIPSSLHSDFGFAELVFSNQIASHATPVLLSTWSSEFQHSAEVVPLTDVSSLCLHHLDALMMGGESEENAINILAICNKSNRM